MEQLSKKTRVSKPENKKKEKKTKKLETLKKKRQKHQQKTSPFLVNIPEKKSTLEKSLTESCTNATLARKQKI